MGQTGSPLSGIRVVDFGQWMAGPTTARLLADNGAEVVHVDPAGGWRWSSQAAAVLNAGKRRIELDLTDPDHLARAHELVAGCDVLVENFRPGALERFGLDPASVRAAHPRIVYLSLPGFASADEEHAAVAAYEAVIAAGTGQFSDMGVNRVLMGVPASYSPLPLGSAYAGVFGAMAVALALRARLRHGCGEHIEVPIASSLLEALAYNSMHVTDVPVRYLSRREQAIQAGARNLSYEQVQTLLDPFYKTYWCSDGKPFYVVALSHRRHPRRLLELLGLWEESVAAGLPMHDPYLPTSQWPEGADCTLFAHPISAAWSDWLSTRIAAVLSTRSSRHWEAAFAAAGIPGAATRSTPEWLDSEHARACGLLVEDDDPRLGPVRRMGPVAWTQPVPGRRCAQRAPGPTDPTAGWLEDTVVVDLTNVVAGPTIGSTLARYGARVVKVDPPEPTFDPWNAVLCGLHANRGKESFLLDARSELGRPALERLLGRADVITVNASEQQLARLGLTGADLARLAPEAVLCHLDAWSGPDPGPWAQRPGYDDLVQAATGIMARFGGGLDTPEEHAHFGTIDVLAGLAGAAATAFALYAKEATGTLFVARTSLAAVGQLIQAPYLIATGSPRPDEPAGPAARGECATYRIYQTSDGWAFVVIPSARLSDLGRVLGQPELGTLAQEELTQSVAALLIEHPTAHWQKTLAPWGISVQPLESLQGLRRRHAHTGRRPWTQSSYHFTTTHHEALGRDVTLVAPVAVRPATARIVIPTDAPKYGEHTEAILTELGYGPDEIDQILAAGAAWLSWSTEYLPS